MYRKETLTVDGSPMEVMIDGPEGPGPHPGVVVAQHLPVAHEGLEKDPFTIDVAKKLADAGYVSVTPFVFHWWAPEVDIEVKRAEFRDDRCVADMQAGFDLLAGMDNVDADRIGVIGHCWGGRVSWLHACHNPNYKALVTLYGGRVKLPMGDGVIAPIELAGNIPCPVLGIFGNDDQNPSPADADDYAAALEAGGVPHEFHRYDGAGHGFQDFVNKDRFREAQTKDSWDKIFAFLGKQLG
jgi:carboxymethylenebutenolidase